MKTNQKLFTLGAAILALTGCPEEGAVDDSEMTIVVEADTEQLKAKEAAIAARRQELERQREDLLKERATLVEGNGDGAEDLKAALAAQKKLLEKERELIQKEAEVEKERMTLANEKTKILEGVAAGGRPAAAAAPAAAPAAAANAGGGGSNFAAREKEMAGREKAMSEREADLARREKALAEREARLASREAAVGIDAQESLAAAQEALAEAAAASKSEPGRTVRRKDVVRAHKRVRVMMQKRGIMNEDLTSTAAASNARYYADSKAGRWAEAMDAVSDLSAAVQSMEIDENFIQSKMARLSALRKKRKVSAADGKRIDGLLGKATAAFADGRHAAANASLNEIHAVLSR